MIVVELGKMTGMPVSTGFRYAYLSKEYTSTRFVSHSLHAATRNFNRDLSKRKQTTIPSIIVSTHAYVCPELVQNGIYSS